MPYLRPPPTVRIPMESDRPDRDAAVPPGDRLDWRALRRLRDRVETAAREIERLRAENAALAARVAELQEGDPGALLAPGESPEALRTRVEAFIATLDRVLAEDESASDGADLP